MKLSSAVILFAVSQVLRSTVQACGGHHHHDEEVSLLRTRQRQLGKINDIFDGEGITSYTSTGDNVDGVDQTIAAFDRAYFADAAGLGHMSETLLGPTVITESTSTTVVPAGWRCDVLADGTLRLERGA